MAEHPPVSPEERVVDHLFEEIDPTIGMYRKTVSGERFAGSHSNSVYSGIFDKFESAVELFSTLQVVADQGLPGKEIFPDTK